MHANSACRTAAVCARGAVFGCLFGLPGWAWAAQSDPWQWLPWSLLALLLPACWLWQRRPQMRPGPALEADSSFRRAMDESVPTGLRALDLEGRITYVNRAFCRMVGYEKEELIGLLPPFPYWPQEDLERCWHNLRLTLAGQAPAGGFEMRIRRKSGELIDARFYLSALIDAEGRHGGWMGSVTDITEPRRIRAELESAHERFEAVLDGVDAAVFVADARSDEILFANRAFRSIHGADVLGRSARGIVVPQPERGDYRVDPRRLSADEVPRELFDGELRHPLSGRWYHVREQAMRWVDGRVVRIGMATDVTDRKEAAELARQQQERLQRTARLITLGEMASTLAHELNQPLGAITNYCMGCVTRLQSGTGSREELLAAMSKAAQQAERAGKIIHRIRAFVKKSEPRRAPVALAEIVDDALGFAEADAKKAGVELVCELADDLPLVLADRILIEQVLLNLVRNGIEAMENTPQRLRRLVVQAAPGEGALAQQLVVKVCDHGHGLDETARAHLFSPFYTTKPDGMGMGLNICRSIVEFHQGRLWVEEAPHGGTIFAFTLPLENHCEQPHQSG